MKYEELLKMIEGLAEEKDFIARLANTSACLMEYMEDISWCGFYLVQENELVLGPFQGKIACTHIGYGQGVCGTCWKEEKTQCVKDVHTFPGHIACDSASNSEIVVPLKVNQKFVGVLDVDSTSFDRFGLEEVNFLEAVSQQIGK